MQRCAVTPINLDDLDPAPEVRALVTVVVDLSKCKPKGASPPCDDATPHVVISPCIREHLGRSFVAYHPYVGHTVLTLEAEPHEVDRVISAVKEALAEPGSLRVEWWTNVEQRQAS